MRIRELAPWRSREQNQLSLKDGGGGDSLTTLQSEMGRLFDSFFEGFGVGPFGKTGLLAPGSNMPKVDVSETNDAVHVTAELPGVREEDIEVSLADGSLVIQGEKRAEKQEKEKNYHRIERTYGSFQRSVPLPAEVDETKVDASFKNGVLNVVLPKRAPAESAAK